MREFFHYFFGKGDEVEFVNFSLAHFLPIVIVALIIFLIFKFRTNIKNYKHEDRIRMTLAFVLIVCEMSYFWRLVGIPELNPNPHEHLPITICGWAIIFCSYLLVTKNQTLYDFAYFWVFSGTIFALITPTVITYTGPTRFRYYQFWGEHLFGYLAIFYMTFVHGMRPNVKSLVKSYCLLIVLAGIAFVANQTMGPGANYLFMAELEETKSLLNYLPKNFVLRVLLMAFVVSILFVLSYLPWVYTNKKNKNNEENRVLEEVIV